MPKIISRFVFLGLLFSTAFCTDSLNLYNRQVNFSYWNDNVGFQRQIKGLLPLGDDDFMTASWRLDIGTGDAKMWDGVELYFAIFTNRIDKNRFDLLSVRYYKEFSKEDWFFKVGTGALVCGNFGGGWIQNKFHALNGYSQLKLDYINRSYFGGLLYFRTAYSILKSRYITIQPYATSTLRIGTGPSNMRVGLEFNKNYKSTNLPIRATSLFRIGYAHYLNSAGLMESHFAHGPVVALQLGIVYLDQIGITLWITENQYGLADPQYGISLSYRRHSLKLPKLHSVMFP